MPNLRGASPVGRGGEGRRMQHERSAVVSLVGNAVFAVVFRVCTSLES